MFLQGMHKEILSQNQWDLLPLINSFKREYYLVGGTAIALYIGHRRSIDFDLFKKSTINHKKNIDKITSFNLTFTITRKVSEQMNLIVNGVKITFFEYPFDIKPEKSLDRQIKLPSLLDLAAMKSYALGRRSKWKDYVDLYFLIKDYFTIEDISKRAIKIFGELFSEKLFRAQLIYFDDIDYTEEVEYLNVPPTNDEIKDFLVKYATNVI